MTSIAPERIALVLQDLPASAVASVDSGGYGWDANFVENLMITRSFGTAEAIRFFWLQRVNETSEYLDAGKPLTQIHRQAKEMLDYWDNIIKLGGPNANGPNARRPLTFGVIAGPTEC